MKNNQFLRILFEDRDFIVIHKPAGLLSVGYPGYSGKTAEDILSDMFRGKGAVRVRAVHRLDRETSGVMLFARSEEARNVMMDQWQNLVSRRLYRCVCLHDPRREALPPSGLIDAPLAYNRQHKAYVPELNDCKGAAKIPGKTETAVTGFRVIDRGRCCDLVECELETGRKNQIRAHMAYLGHPVAGDRVYGTGNAGFPEYGLALHARILAFTHPFTGEPHLFEVPEPDFFRLMLSLRIVPEKDGKTKKTGTPLASGYGYSRRGRSGGVSGGSRFIPGK